jgi:multiple sugar transport system ATP-binding protein
MTMADRIVVMQCGVIQQVGPPLAVYADPVNHFVAGFFGVPPMNFVDGALAADAGRLAFRAAGVTIVLDRPAEAVTARDAVLGVRPEHVRLRDGTGGWPATVGLLEPLGDETIVFLDYGGATSIVAKVDPDEKIAVGDRRRFMFDRGKLLFFDGTTGERILR